MTRQLNFEKFLIVIWSFMASSVLACPFDEAGIEVTILAHKEISEVIDAGDFKAASQKIESRKYLYEYFEQSSKEPLYKPMIDASNSNNGKEVLRLLDRSLVLEVRELIDQVETMFDDYQKSRLRLVKAKKHLEALTSEKEPMKIMKKILQTIGNPGLMGVGQRKADKDAFLVNKDILYKMLDKA